MLITVDQAKLHLRIDADTAEHDELLELVVPMASAIVLDYLKRDAASWQTTAGAPEDVPGPVQAATLLVMEALVDGVDEPLSQPVKNLLHRYRDPALA